MHGGADRARLVSQGPRDGLPDPPRCVRRKLEPFAVVELFYRAREPDVPLLYQIQNAQFRAAVRVAFCYRNHEPQIGLHKALPCVLVARGRTLGKLPLFCLDQERRFPYLAQIPLHRIRRSTLEIGRGFELGRARLAAAPPADLDESARLDNLDIRLFEPVVDLIEERYVLLDVGKVIENLVVRHGPPRPAALDELGEGRLIDREARLAFLERLFLDLPLRLLCARGRPPPPQNGLSSFCVWLFHVEKPVCLLLRL